MKRSSRIVFIAIGSCLMLQACASVVDGSSQTISVKTTPVNGASCTITNNSGTWSIANTPADMTVHRDESNLVVTCKKQSLSGTAKVASNVKAIVMDSMLMGGLIGRGIDYNSGAAFEYPASINVPMSKGGKVTIVAPPQRMVVAPSQPK